MREQSRSFADAGRRKGPEAVPRQRAGQETRPNGSPLCWSQPPEERRNPKPPAIRERRSGSQRWGSQSGNSNACGENFETRPNPDRTTRWCHPPARMRLSRDPTAVNRDDNRNLPRVRTCKAVDELKRPPQEVYDFRCRCQFGYAQPTEMVKPAIFGLTSRNQRLHWD